MNGASDLTAAPATGALTVPAWHPARDAIALLMEGHKDPRAAALLDAARCVLKSRSESYGAPEDNFAAIAGFAGSWLNKRMAEGEAISPGDIALMGVSVKLGRLLTDPRHWDSIVDAIGYLACYARVVSIPEPAEAADPLGQNAMLRAQPPAPRTSAAIRAERVQRWTAALAAQGGITRQDYERDRALAAEEAAASAREAAVREAQSVLTPAAGGRG